MNLRRDGGLWLMAIAVAAVLLGVIGQPGQDARQRKARAVATPTATPQAKPQRRHGKYQMATYIVAGAGDAAYSGAYPETGTYGGASYFQLDAGHFIFFSVPDDNWTLGTFLGDGGSGTHYLHAGDPSALPTGLWDLGPAGVGPAPTVTLDSSESGPVTGGAFPYNGCPGETRVFVGTGLLTVVSFKFNGVVAIFTIDDDEHITATIPLSATTGPVTIADSDGNGSAPSGDFIVFPLPATPPPPNITGIAQTAFNIGYPFPDGWPDTDSMQAQYRRVVDALWTDAGAALNLSGTLDEDVTGAVVNTPYLARLVAQNDCGDTSGPATAFSTLNSEGGGGGGSGLAPPAPDECRATDLQDVRVTIILPALPDTADSLWLQQKISDVWTTIRTGLAAAAEVVVESLTLETDYDFRAVASNDFGQTPGSACDVRTEAEPTVTTAPDTTAPTVTLDYPGGESGGATNPIATPGNFATVIATAQDLDGEIKWVDLLVDGARVARLSAPNFPARPTPVNRYRFAWPVAGVVNGSHTLTVRATNAADLTATASRAVVLSRTISNTRAVIFWLPNTIPDAGRVYRDIVPVLLCESTGDAADDWAWQWWVRTYVDGDDSLDLADFTPVTERALAALLQADATRGRNVRVMLTATPLLVRGTLDTGTLEAIRLHLYDSGAKLGVLTRGPNGLQSFNGVSLSEVADLSGFSGYLPNDFAFAGNRWYVALEPTDAAPDGTPPLLLAVSPDAVEDSYEIKFPAPIRAMAAANGVLYLGTDDDLGNPDSGRLYSFDPTANAADARKLLSATLPGIVRLYATPASPTLPVASIAVGVRGGDVYTHVIASGATTLFNATGAGAVHSLNFGGGVSRAGTGDAGELWSDAGSAWALEATLDLLTKVLALARLGGTVYAGGDSPLLWRLAGGVWSQVDSLENVTGINDGIVFNGVLVLATSGSGPNIHTRETAPLSEGAVRGTEAWAYGFYLRAMPEVTT